MSKNVLIHTIVFNPDGVSTAYLYSDIAVGLRKLGHTVKVITTTPHYNIVDADFNKRLLKKKVLGLYYESDYQGIPVYHIPATKSKWVIMRLLSFCYFHFLSLILSLMIGRIDIVLAPSPPLTIGLIGIIIAKYKGGKAIYNVQEIYPDFIINQGLLKNRLVIKGLRKLESFIYNHSRFVITIDEKFADIIRPRIHNKNGLVVIPNFVDTELYQPYTKQNEWSNNFGYKDKFIVMYAGNIGFAQDWGPILFAAKKIADLPIQIIIIGEGVKKEELAYSIKAQGLTNISLLGYQKRESMPLINAFADIHFISMNPDMDKEGFPSKVYSIFSSGRPLIVSAGKDTPLAAFVKKVGAGIVSPVKNDDAFSDHIIQYYLNPQLVSDHGKKAREYIVSNFSKELIVEKYHDLIMSA